MVKSIKLMAEYGNTVLWGVNVEDIGPIDPNELPLTSDLKAALQNWAAAYDATLNQDYPPDSGFASPAEEEAFELESRRLWRALQEELGPDYKVVFQSVRDNQLHG